MYRMPMTFVRFIKREIDQAGRQTVPNKIETYHAEC